MSEPVSVYRLEKLVLGELSAQESSELLKDPDVARRVDALRRSNDDFIARHPLKQTGNGRSGPRIVRFSAPRALFPAAAAAALLVVVGTGLFLRSGAGVDDGTRLKGGGAALYLYRKTSAEAVELRSGSTAKQGDAIQAAYSASGRAYGCIISIDGNGQLTSHLPEAGAAAVELSRGELKVLDSSYILDAAPKYELFLLVSSGKPFQLDRVETAALEIPVDSKFAAALEKRLGSAFSVVAVTLIKE